MSSLHKISSLGYFIIEIENCLLYSCVQLCCHLEGQILDTKRPDLISNRIKKIAETSQNTHIKAMASNHI